MDARVGHLDCHWRIHGDRGQAAAVALRLDRVVRDALPDALDQALDLALGDDPRVYVLRRVESRLWLPLADYPTDTALARRWGERLAGSVVRAIAAGSDGGSLVSFEHQADYVAHYLSDRLSGPAADRWYYGAFRAFDGLPTGAAVLGVLLDHRDQLPAILAWLAHCGTLERVLAVLEVPALRSLWRSGVCGSPAPAGTTGADLERVVAALTERVLPRTSAADDADWLDELERALIAFPWVDGELVRAAVMGAGGAERSGTGAAPVRRSAAAPDQDRALFDQACRLLERLDLWTGGTACSDRLRAAYCPGTSADWCDPAGLADALLDIVAFLAASGEVPGLGGPPPAGLPVRLEAVLAEWDWLDRPRLFAGLLGLLSAGAAIRRDGSDRPGAGTAFTRMPAAPAATDLAGTLSDADGGLPAGPVVPSTVSGSADTVPGRDGGSSLGAQALGSASTSDGAVPGREGLPAGSETLGAAPASGGTVRGQGGGVPAGAVMLGTASPSDGAVPGRYASLPAVTAAPSEPPGDRGPVFEWYGGYREETPAVTPWGSDVAVRAARDGLPRLLSASAPRQPGSAAPTPRQQALLDDLRPVLAAVARRPGGPAEVDAWSLVVYATLVDRAPRWAGDRLAVRVIEGLAYLSVALAPPGVRAPVLAALRSGDTGGALAALPSGTPTGARAGLRTLAALGHPALGLLGEPGPRVQGPTAAVSSRLTPGARSAPPRWAPAERVETDCAGALLLLRACTDLKLPLLARGCGCPATGPTALPGAWLVPLLYRLAGIGTIGAVIDPGLSLLLGTGSPADPGSLRLTWRGTTQAAHQAFQAALLRVLAGQRLCAGDWLHLYALAGGDGAVLLIGGDDQGRLWPLAGALDHPADATSLLAHWVEAWQAALGRRPAGVVVDGPTADSLASAEVPVAVVLAGHDGDGDDAAVAAAADRHERGRQSLMAARGALACAHLGIPAADLTLDQLAIAVLRAWARWLPRLADSSAPYLLEHFIRRRGTLTLEGNDLLVELDPKPFDVVIEMAGYLGALERVDWLGGRNIRFRIGRATWAS
jgi:hypothetical protein